MAHRVGPQELRLAQGGVVADDVRDGLLRLEVEVGRDAAELQVEIDQDDPIGPTARRGDRDVRGDGRRADAALGAVDRHRAARLGQGQAIGETRSGHVLRPLEAQQQRLDPRLDLASVEGPGDDVVGAGLQEADPLLDLIGDGHAQEGHRGHRRGGPDLATQVDAALDRRRAPRPRCR